LIILDLLWWLGWAWFALWVALPLLLLPRLGAVPGAIAWAVLAPWTALFGMAVLHRMLPPSRPGRFRMFADRGSRCWALRTWAPGVYLTVFQPVFFLSPAFQRLALRAFGAQLGAGALVTSRTVLREPHHVRIGAGSLVGEFVHLAPSYQLRAGRLEVGTIVIGDGVLIGAHSVLAPGAQVGHHVVLEHAVSLGAHSVIGDRARIGGGSFLYSAVRVGVGAVIGKGCIVPAGTVIPAGARIPDGTVLGQHRSVPLAASLP
jgi:acetyltransferase-like isoleucine patch superfamily enzyme